jgi:hypothetical protein
VCVRVGGEEGGLNGASRTDRRTVASRGPATTANKAAPPCGASARPRPRRPSGARSRTSLLGLGLATRTPPRGPGRVLKLGRRRAARPQTPHRPRPAVAPLYTAVAPLYTFTARSPYINICRAVAPLYTLKRIKGLQPQRHGRSVELGRRGRQRGAGLRPDACGGHGGGGGGGGGGGSICEYILFRFRRLCPLVLAYCLLLIRPDQCWQSTIMLQNKAA